MRTLWALLLLLPTSAWADEIFLKNGSSIKGVVREENDRTVTIEIGQGTIEIERRHIARISRDQSSAVQDFEERYHDLAQTAEDYWTLADWCSRNRVTTALRSLIDQAVALESSAHTKSQADLVLRLVQLGIRFDSIKSWIEMGALPGSLRESDLGKLREKSPELADWAEPRVRPPAPPAAIEPPKMVQPPPAANPNGPIVCVPQKRGRDETWQRVGYPECPYYYPIVVQKNPYPWIPNYYGPYIYYNPYVQTPIITTPPSTGSYR